MKAFDLRVLTIVTVASLGWPNVSHGESIGSPIGRMCLWVYGCCYPADPQSEELGDNFYNASICDQNKINYWWSRYQMEADDWDDGWGFHYACDRDKPLARLFHAMEALQFSAPAGAPPDAPLAWGFDYAMTEGQEPIPDCADHAFATAKDVGVDEWIQLHYIFFYYSGYTVPQRAATLIHEARHLQDCHHLADDGDCSWGGGCDLAWDAACLKGGSWAAGANQFGLVWLWDYFASAVNTNDSLKQKAVDWANQYLARRFKYDPCFRIGPDGKAYQLPIPDCKDTGDQTDFGTASLVRAEEWNLEKCLQGSYVVRSVDCSPPNYYSQKWRLEPVRDQHGEVVADGRVRIVEEGTGNCLRLSQAPTQQTTLLGGVVCESVPWNTTILLSACTGQESEFYVTPWAPEDTSPGLIEPENFRRWRIRPHLRCFDSDTLGDPVPREIMKYGDACLDANSLGDDQLRVFWCHDSPRQQFRATAWY